MNLMQLFNPQAGAGSPQPGGGIMPAANDDERRAFARALLMASSRLATQPGNFAQGLTTAIGEGGLGYYNELDRLEQQRLEEERWRGNQAIAQERTDLEAARDARDFAFRQQNEQWDRNYKEQDLKSRDAARRADAEAKAGRAADVDGLTVYEVEKLLREKKGQLLDQYSEELKSGDFERQQAAQIAIREEMEREKGYLKSLLKPQPQGIGADSEPRAALPSGTTSSGIQWSVEQ